MSEKRNQKAGRPAYKVTKELLDKVETLAAQGLTQAQICDCIGWSEETMCKKKKAYTELSEAMKRGKAKGLAIVTQSLINNAKTGNVTAQIFYLKNRCPEEWSDRRENINMNHHSVSGELKDALLKDE